MTRTPASPCDDGLRARLAALLQAGDVDAALQAGLMAYPASATADDASIRAAQERLRAAWAARERYRARADRLARQAAERDAKRAAARPGAGIAPMPPTHEASAAGAGATPASAAAAAAPPSTLPPAAAAALARARARAAGRPRE